uniref:Sugar transporter n=2 Tax=Bursaphelenchus xylophilus TaxID=6326 RepID=A0A1I7SJH6_BURXY
MGGTVDDNESDRHIFQLGICFLLGWMLVIILCASPQ